MAVPVMTDLMLMPQPRDFSHVFRNPSAFTGKLNIYIKRVRSRYKWLKKNMPVLLKPFNVDCTVIGTSEMYTSQTCSWCGTRLNQTQAQKRSKYKTCGACGKTFHRDVMAAENMLHSAHGNIDTTTQE